MEPVALTAESPDSGATVTPEGKNIVGESKDPYGYRYLMKHFDVDEGDERASKAYAKVWEWAKGKTVGKSREEILFEVVRLNRKLGTTGNGMKPWALMENYVNTHNHLRETERRLQAMEGNATI